MKRSLNWLYKVGALVLFTKFSLIKCIKPLVLFNYIYMQELIDKYVLLQEKYFDETECFIANVVPLKIIPEIEYKMFRDSIDWKGLRKYCKENNINQYSDPECLSDWLIQMKIYHADISLEYKVTRKIWDIYRDEINDLYWKSKNNYDVEMDVRINFLMWD